MDVWIDVIPYGDDFAYVASGNGYVRAFTDAQELWRTEVPQTDIVRYIRGAAAPDGSIVTVGQGGDNNAWVVSASGVTNAGVAAGQDPTAIVYDSGGFVIYRTISGNQYAIDKAGRTEVVDMPQTSQGFREVFPDGTVHFGDNYLIGTKIEGYQFWRRAEKFGFVGGQAANGKGEGLGILQRGSNHFMWVGPFGSESPHFALNKDKVAVVAFTGGGAFRKSWSRPFPIEAPFVETKPDEPIKPPVEEPKDPPMAEPASLSDLVHSIRGRMDVITDINTLGEMLNEVAWEGNKRIGKVEWGLSAKPGGHGTRQPKTGIKIAADILHHKPTNQLYDVFGGATAENGGPGPATPGWGKTTFHNAPDRPWVAPVEPEGVVTEPDEPDVPDTPDEDEGGDIGDMVDLVRWMKEVSEALSRIEKKQAEQVTQTKPPVYKGKFFGATITLKPEE
jgi:hypothetical protein